MKVVRNPRPQIDENLIRPYREMNDVMSLSCVISDAMDRENAMKDVFKLMGADKKIIGPAFTIKQSNADFVDCIYELRMAKPGDVIVIDTFEDSDTALWGGLMSGIAKNSGLAGTIVNGAVRDADESRLLGYPVYARHKTPRATPMSSANKEGPIQINVPVVCGGVVVNPGDLIVGDENGIVVVPYGELEQVYPLALAQAQKDSATRKDLMAGMTIDDLMAKFGRI